MFPLVDSGQRFLALKSPLEEAVLLSVPFEGVSLCCHLHRMDLCKLLDERDEKG